MPRAGAEKVLGKPLWHVGADADLTYEVYEIRAAQPAKPATGAVIAGLDYFSVGSFEYILRDEGAYAPHKQVVIGYDRQGVVALKSGPWEANASPACRRVRSLLPTDLGLPAAPRADDLVGNGESPTSAASLKIDSGFEVVLLDNLSLAGRTVSLEPGRHTLAYRTHDYESPAIDLAARPGHTYLLRNYKRGKGEHYLWLEDAETHETFQCHDPP